MKFKCEIEIDWINDESTLDEAVKLGIIKEVLSKISDDAKNNIKVMVDDKLIEKIESTINDTLSNFLNRPITITDNYGDVKESYSDVTDMLKTKFDDFLLEKVDKQGKVAGRSRICSHGDKPRIERLLENAAKETYEKIKRTTDKFSDTILRDVDNKIKEQLNVSLKEKISETLVKKINLDSVLA